MRLIHTSLFAAIAALGLAACNPQPAAPQAKPRRPRRPTAPPPNPLQPAAGCRTGGRCSATAELAPTQGNEAKGSVTFKVVDGKVHVTGQITGLKPGSEHGFHIHEKGDCSAPDGMSAGGHFNPGKQDHGNVATDPHHGGDMPNIKADDKGVATIDGPVSSNVNIGKGDDFDIIGRGLIVHADADDYKTSRPARRRAPGVRGDPEGPVSIRNAGASRRSSSSVVPLDPDVAGQRPAPSFSAPAARVRRPASQCTNSTAAISAGNGKRRRKPAFFFFIGSAGLAGIADPDVAGQAALPPSARQQLACVLAGLAVHEQLRPFLLERKRRRKPAFVLLYRVPAAGASQI